MIDHRQPKLILRNLQNVGHYKTLYWGFAHFLKIVEYCYYCGNKVYLPSVHLVLVCCAQFERDSRSIWGRKSRGKIRRNFPPRFSPSNTQYGLFQTSHLGHVEPNWIELSGGRGVLPRSKRLLGMCRWMGSHFHIWIDYNGVTFLVELLECGRTFSEFLE